MPVRKLGVTMAFVLLVSLPGLGQGDPGTLTTFRTHPTFVEVPVTVKESSGRLVEGLPSQDFTVFEDGVPQRLAYFSRDPLPLSAAVAVDTNLPTAALDKVIRTLPALVDAFTSVDEVAVYRYGDSVQQVVPFTPMAPASGDKSGWTKWAGEPGNHAVPGGASGTSPGNTQINTNAGSDAGSPETGVLNDAILLAAQDLSRRDQAGRRRIIFVIGSGREKGSTARYSEVSKFLLSQNISVYALSLDYSIFLQYGRLLSQYAKDTGGDIFGTSEERSMDEAYSKIINQARNQYMLGYFTRARLPTAYRSIDVHVHHPDLTVLARAGCYVPTAPLP